ncbi:ubiquinone biosynthesis accessory factor UbiJ [Marinobacterium sediminicola]|uniref:Ubiquinone biosynthesis accessory factor UbiJ n=1 Tax=Marinobacterium sediminicola TaxID=518898 RepID=A0ABY1S1U9_9GAMM|nr:SCP2 sterol-binding domain-containing protein [Marinobacterium sediminicola]ULG69511.1 SCP2 sterol-binding domain-containing protein [Marinobacterium sediminicola]SMR75662.1 ubiquinone biosynthesis protein UbiJ [Marinobacterium sediminicola]
MASGMINATLLTLAEASLNRVLARDPVTLARLGELAGCEIRVECHQPEWHCTLLPHNQGIDLLAESGDEADACIRGSALNLIRLPQAGNQVLFGHGVTIEGDSGLVHRLQQILADSQIDWEAWLADIIGDTAAHPLANLLRTAAHQLRYGSSSLIHSLEEYLHEEARLLPTQVEIDIWQEQVEELREATDRLEARIARLEHKQARTD